MLSHNLQTHGKKHWRSGSGQMKTISRQTNKTYQQIKKNILHQAKMIQEDIGNLSVKRVMVRAGISPSVSTATVCRANRKAG